MTGRTPTRALAAGPRGRAAAIAAAAGKGSPTRARVHTRATPRPAAAARALRDGLALVPGWAWTWRHRRPLTPPAAAVTVWVTGLFGHALPWRPAAAAAVLLVVAAVAVFSAMMSQTVTATTAITCWLALAWLLTALVAPPWHRVTLTAAAVTAVPVVACWWWRGTRQPPTPVGVPEQVATWAVRLAGDKQALPGSTVTKAAALATGGKVVGFRLIVQLPPGALTFQDAVKATAKIASAYGVDALAVTVEPTPSRDASAAMVTVMEKSPLHAVQQWRKPSLDHDRGTFQVGVYEDGKPALWRLWRPKSGAVHGLIAGTTGSGKSGTSNVLLAEAALSGICVIFLIDPKAGQSLPEWSQSLPADRVARTEREWDRMLEGLVRVNDARARHLATVDWTDAEGRPRRGMSHFDPKPDMPLIVLFVDEAFTVLPEKAPAVRLLELLGTKGRSVGIAVVAATQVPSVKSLGNSGTLRSMFSSGQVMVLRTSDKVSAGMALMDNLPVDPTQISPDHPGMGFLSGRTAAMRGLFVKDPWGVASTAPVLPLDALSAAAYATPTPVPAAATPVPAVADTLRGAPRAIVDRLAWMGPQTRLQLVEALTPGYSERGIRDAIRRLVTVGTLTESPDKKTIALPAAGGPPPV